MNTKPKTEPLDPDSVLIEAELLLGNRERWPEAEELAQRVLDECAGGRNAAKARKLLQRLGWLQGSRPAPDVETLEAREAWATLTGLEDGRLRRVWNQVTTDPRRLGEIQPEIERKLKAWVRELTVALRQDSEAPQDLDRCLEELDLLVGSEGFQQGLELALRDTLTELGVVRFQRRFAIAEPQIRHALGQWHVNRARELLEDLGEPPAGLKEDPLLELWHQLQATEDRHRSFERLQAALSSGKAPESWKDLRRRLELIARAEADRSTIPPTFEVELRSVLETSGQSALRFVERQANAVGTLEAIRELGRRLDGLESRFSAAGVEFGTKHLAPAIKALEAVWREKMGQVEEKKELTALQAEINAEGICLPLPLKDVCRFWSERVTALVRKWDEVKRGESPGELPSWSTPSSFKKEYDEASRIAEQITQGFEALESGTLEQIRRARKIAEEILVSRDGHREAERLRCVATERELGYELEEQLLEMDSGKFDVELYVQMATHELAPETHRKLARHPHVLKNLARLLPQAPFEDAVAAVGWWTCLVEACQALPDSLPAILEERLNAEISERRKHWILVLNLLSKREKSSRAWCELAEGLEVASGNLRFDPDNLLERQRRELLQRSKLAKVTEHLDRKRFEAARKMLDTIEGDAERKRRLAVRLAIEGPIHHGDLANLAMALDRYWALAVEIYGREANDKLLGALEVAWGEGDNEVLETLASVLKRALARADVESERDRLQHWSDWLGFAKQMKWGLKPMEVQPLLAHLECADAELRGTRILWLIQCWRDVANRLSLAWAFRALPELRHDLFPDGVDPADLLEQDEDRFVDRTGSFLNKTLPADREPLRFIRDTSSALLQQGEELEKEIQELGHLVDELSFPVEPFRAKESFYSSLREVRKIVDILRDLLELESSDLRQERDRCRRVRTLIREIRSPWRKHLEESLGRMEPLSRLTYDENQIFRAADRCADPEALDTPEVFQSVADAVRIIGGRLEKSGFSMAPVAEAIIGQYWKELPERAHVEPPIASEGTPSLEDLIRYFDSLEVEDRSFTALVDELEDKEPPVGAGGRVDAERHRHFFALVPNDPPNSWRVHRLLERYLSFGERRALFESGVSAGFLPAWFSDLPRGTNQ